jgi:hypothetical protein
MRVPPEVAVSKGSDKPKKQQKRKPHETLKERHSERRAAKEVRWGSFSAGRHVFLPADTRDCRKLDG